MPKKVILGADDVVKKLEWLQKQSKKHNDVGVIVGYTANYALWVHESPGTLKGKPRGAKKGSKRGKYRGHYWDPQGRAQPKFLEAPFRLMKDRLYAVIFQTTKRLGIAKGNGLDIGLMNAGLLLQRTSQLLVPVDLGNLKGSAFTRLVHRNRGKG